MRPKKTTVYIDGFNLYYGSLKGTNFKWIDLNKLCCLTLPSNQINKIKYFSARVKSRIDDHDLPNRQQIYLRAIKTLPNVEIILGHFLSHVISLPLANPQDGKNKFVDVIKFEEKGSDVNIATHLVNDGHKNEYEAAVLLTNDSDLKEPIKIIRNELKLTVGILCPQKRPNRELALNASFVKMIRKGVLEKSQFPDTLQDKTGEFHKPKVWQ